MGLILKRNFWGWEQRDTCSRNISIPVLNILDFFQAFKAAEEEVQARWKYEDNIKGPYFHMKPLERGQVCFGFDA